ncbi:hypothetical protein CRE_16222 [Caenorhabditis remanei]|uniref:C6 domain-containing protein n=1 Tax=Caenorhabditis remanei TaxID=31234 RepID=E3MSM9_CAERE|nr:hypothetical protein CRE_16222 [Caenorhabditis remanei]
MILRLIITTFFTISLVEMCVRMIPPEEVSISTTASSLPTDAPGEITTERTATSSETGSPTTGVPVTDTPVTDTPVTEDPTDLCTTCNIQTIKPDPIPTGVVFSFVENAADGECIETKATCTRNDGMICTDIKMFGTTATGQVSITDSTTTTKVSATLSCANDGTYSWGTTTGITKLACQFESCTTPTPCQTCDISKISPTNPLPGTSFVSEENIVNGCQVITVTCKRDDGLICSSVAVLAEFPTGISELSSTMNGDSATSVIECNENGKYSYRGIEITALSCDFIQCPPPCTSCDISTIPLTVPPAGTSLIPQENTINGCKAATITCQREDGQVCTSVAVQATTSTGVSEIGSTMGLGVATAELTCSADGKYTTGTGTEITGLSCNFNQCPPPPSCLTCDINTIAPKNLPMGTSFTSTTTILNNCRLTTITCKRDDGLICSSVAVWVTSLFGTFALRTNYNNDNVATTITCNANGIYSAPMLPGISAISCVFNQCPPCKFNSVFL